MNNFGAWDFALHCLDFPSFDGIFWLLLVTQSLFLSLSPLPLERSLAGIMDESLGLGAVRTPTPTRYVVLENVYI